MNRLAAGVLACGCLSGALAAEAPAPAWLNNDLGREEIVLPGFSPVRTVDHRVELGGKRTYDWSDRLLPVEISSQGRVLVAHMELVARVRGSDRAVQAATRMARSVDHHAELQGTSATVPDVAVEVRSRVEFDGMAIVDVTVSSVRGAALDGLELRFTVPRDPDMKVLAFDPATIYYQWVRSQFVPECYRGPYKNVLGFAYGNASFWWLADDLDRSVLGDAPITSIRCDGNLLRVSQPLLATPRRVDSPLHFRFGFLATPVRDLGGQFRRDRIAVNASPEEASVGNRNLWWIEATAHHGLPYLEYPPGAKEKLPLGDIQAYPGPIKNRAVVQSWRKLGLERLPYNSLRGLSFLDPVIEQFESRWRVLPPLNPPAYSDAPYKAARSRAILSHRGPGFSDYLLSRLKHIADGLQVRGFYFDQAAPIGSANPAHLATGAPPGSAATDILAMREFFKRLATLLYQNGMPPLIYAHNSAAPVVPAYTFVTGMVQGEDFIDELKTMDYQGSFDLDRIRATLAPDGFGVPTIWLEELWSESLVAQRPLRYRWADPRTWLASDEYRQGWRNFMALALLHDIPVWTHAPVEYRRQLFRQLDDFGVDRGRFVGYWELTRVWRDSPILVSAYVHEQDGRTLLIVANRDVVPRQIEPGQLDALLNPAALRAAALTPPRTLGWAGGNRTVPARDFVLIESN
jgi:hypothetical protein